MCFVGQATNNGSKDKRLNVFLFNKHVGFGLRGIPNLAQV